MQFRKKLLVWGGDDIEVTRGNVSVLVHSYSSLSKGTDCASEPPPQCTSVCLWGCVSVCTCTATNPTVINSCRSKKNRTDKHIRVIVHAHRTHQVHNLKNSVKNSDETTKNVWKGAVRRFEVFCDKARALSNSERLTSVPQAQLNGFGSVNYKHSSFNRVYKELLLSVLHPCVPLHSGFVGMQPPTAGGASSHNRWIKDTKSEGGCWGWG